MLTTTPNRPTRTRERTPPRDKRITLPLRYSYDPVTGTLFRPEPATIAPASHRNGRTAALRPTQGIEATDATQANTRPAVGRPPKRPA